MLRTKRWEYLGGPCLDNPPDWSPSKLLKFLHKAKIDEMNLREENPLSQIPWTGFLNPDSGTRKIPKKWNNERTKKLELLAMDWPIGTTGRDVGATYL